MQKHAEKEGSLFQPRRMFFFGFELTNGTIITLLLLFYLELRLVCTKIYRFAEYTPVNCVSNSVQSAVNARRQGDQNYNSSVVAETLRLPANSSYGYQIIDHSRHSVKTNMNDKKTQAGINKKTFQDVWTYQRSSSQGIVAKSEIEHKESIIVGFFILQFAKL